MTEESPQRAAKPKCPICRKPVDLRGDGNGSYPFCSEHCQMHDLGNWLDECYTLPIGQDATERSLPESFDPNELN